MMFGWIKDAFRFDGIQDDEIPADSDWRWLTPMERIGIQTQADADIARRLIEERKAHDPHGTSIASSTVEDAIREKPHRY